MTIPTQDTICAISTAPGTGGIAVIRISGSNAIDIADKIWHGKSLRQALTHTAHLGTITDSTGCQLDQAVATVFRAPHTFTGEDVVEISVHGSRYIQQQLINTLIHFGVRLANAGEFTRRAFASGKMDLAQAEAVADLIASESRAAHRIAMTQMRGQYSQRLYQLREQLLTLTSLLELELDFSEEDVEFASRSQLSEIAHAVQSEVRRLAASFQAGAAIKSGIPVAIIGATNAGKSSLLNALLGDDRAIVSDIHGTTRDIVEDTITIGDYTYRLMDTAGLRHTDDQIERLGIQRSIDAAAKSQILIVVIDSADPVMPELPDVDATLIVAINKTDLTKSPRLRDIVTDPMLQKATHVAVSAKSGYGIDTLRDELQRIAREAEGTQASALVTNIRHYQALIQADQAITRAINGLDMQLSGDLISLDIRQTIDALSEIIGDITSHDVLTTIFSRFCIGK